MVSSAFWPEGLRQNRPPAPPHRLQLVPGIRICPVIANRDPLAALSILWAFHRHRHERRLGPDHVRGDPLVCEKPIAYVRDHCLRARRSGLPFSPSFQSFHPDFSVASFLFSAGGVFTFWQHFRWRALFLKRDPAEIGASPYGADEILPPGGNPGRRNRARGGHSNPFLLASDYHFLLRFFADQCRSPFTSCPTQLTAEISPIQAATVLSLAAGSPSRDGSLWAGSPTVSGIGPGFYVCLTLSVVAFLLLQFSQTLGCSISFPSCTV